MTTGRQIAEWLLGLPGVTEAQAYTLTLAGRTYPAARYYQVQNKLAVEMIYAVGMLPSAYCRSSKLVFRMPDAREWYVAAYAGDLRRGKQLTIRPNDAHPFGNMLILAPWDASQPIDQEGSYRRLSASIENA